MQNKAIKLLSGATRFQSAHLLYKDHNILNLNSLFSQETAKFMYKFIHNNFLFNSIIILVVSWQLTKEVRELHKRKINFIFLDSAQTHYKDPSNIEELKYGTIYLTKLRTTTTYVFFFLYMYFFYFCIFFFFSFSLDSMQLEYKIIVKNQFC